MKTKKIKDDDWVPTEQIRVVLDKKIVDPFIKIISYDKEVSLKLSNAFVLLKLSENLIVEFDSSIVAFGEDITKVKEKNLYLSYFGKVFESALVLLGSNDYLGFIILLRTVFELLIGISTEKTGSMKERIYSIDFIEEDDKKSIHNFWNELSACSDPYGKWIKNVCPLFYGISQNYHPVLFGQCLGYSDIILDLMLTLIIEQFKLSRIDYVDKYKEIFEEGNFSEISNLKIFKGRLTTYS